MAARSSSRASIPSASSVPPECSTSKFPYSLDELDAAKDATRQGQRSRQLLCPAGRLARQRNDGGRGAELDDPCRHRGLGLAEHVRRRDQDEGHQARHRRISPARSADRAVDGQGRRPLHDLHDLEASRRASRLRRRADVRLARPRRRMHRRQCLLRQGRRAAHADRRLLPRRHHAPHGDRPRQAARDRGRRAAHHARRDGDFVGMLHLRHGRRGHARVGNRLLPFHAGSGVARA